ncbi:MAG: hypothetical protein QNJ94_00535 [Alphaproteobacteria bacterium]|nr:hypothetical protein [Alphaproteobacteria bacterium]
MRFFDPARFHFVFLVPLVASNLTSDNAMSAKDLREQFVGNTVVAQLPQGTAYALVRPDGVARGLHPVEGRINGRYEIADDGVVCVTWPLASGEVRNCDKTVAQGGRKYNWEGKTLEVLPGDPKGLGK